MPRNLLTDRAIRNAKPRVSAYRLADGGGLFLRVAPNATKSWEFRYRLNGKPQTLSIGKLDAFPLAQARLQADKARQAAGEGQQLTSAKRVARACSAAAARTTFKNVATAWVTDESRRKLWTADHRADVEASLANHLSTLDGLPIAALSASVCSPALRKLEASKPDTAQKVRQRLRGILDYAVEHGLIAANPLPATRRGAKIQRKHLPAELDAAAVGDILRKADRASVSHGVRRAHLLCVFTAQRISEVVNAKWSEFDLESGIWTLPRERMKRKDISRGPHVVPIPRDLLPALHEWKRVEGRDDDWVCKSPTNDAPVSREAVEKFYKRTLGLANRHTPHGWRSVFSTWARDAGKDSDVIEAQLDHEIGGKVQQAYDRATRLDLRRNLMDWYESKLLAARDGAKVMQLHPSRQSSADAL
jgi:integrase